MEKLSGNSLEKILSDKYKLPLRYQYYKIMSLLDEEMLLISSRLDRKRRFVDIGANIGIWSYHFMNSFERVEAFEPNVDVTFRLKALQKRNITIHNVALSDFNGQSTLHVPVLNGAPVEAEATLKRELDSSKDKIVDVHKLDDYKFDDIDLIKIDVEGHESHVLEGAKDTIKINKPILVVEIEQRHINKPIDEAIDQFIALGYAGHYIDNGALCAIEKFSYEAHQREYLHNVKSRKYINNFIFFPK